MKKIIKIIVSIFIILILAVATLFLVLTITEYKPGDEEEISISGSAKKTLTLDDEFSVVTWNMGYAGLSNEADFFMDGGKEVCAIDKDGSLKNLQGILEKVCSINPDIVFFQEIDQGSSRSYNINQVQKFADDLQEYQYSFANNFKAFVPYPMPPIGKVDSGISIFSKYQAGDAKRIALPCPFDWPIRIANLKRCLLVERIPIEESDKELVLVNLHLEAYDDGEGKIAQTKKLLNLLDDEVQKGNYVIAGGDFNQTFDSVDLSAYPYIDGDIWHPGIIDEEDFALNYQIVMDNSSPTCRSLDKPYLGADTDNFQYYVIDGFIVSNNIEIIDGETIDTEFEFTDHNPVLLKAKFN